MAEEESDDSDSESEDLDDMNPDQQEIEEELQALNDSDNEEDVYGEKVDKNAK